MYWSMYCCGLGDIMIQKQHIGVNATLGYMSLRER